MVLKPSHLWLFSFIVLCVEYFHGFWYCPTQKLGEQQPPTTETNKSREFLMSGLIEFTMMIFEYEKGNKIDWFLISQSSVADVVRECAGEKFVDEWQRSAEWVEFQDDKRFMRKFKISTIRAVNNVESFTMSKCDIYEKFQITFLKIFSNCKRKCDGRKLMLKLPMNTFSSSRSNEQ